MLCLSLFGRLSRLDLEKESLGPSARKFVVLVLLERFLWA